MVTARSRPGPRGHCDLDDTVAALQEERDTTKAATVLAFEHRLALLVLREIDWRDGKRLTRTRGAAAHRR